MGTKESLTSTERFALTMCGVGQCLGRGAFVNDEMTWFPQDTPTIRSWGTHDTEVAKPVLRLLLPSNVERKNKRVGL
eukprot:1601718-Amphidinium_carterae.1